MINLWKKRHCCFALAVCPGPQLMQSQCKTNTNLPVATRLSSLIIQVFMCVIIDLLFSAVHHNAFMLSSGFYLLANVTCANFICEETNIPNRLNNEQHICNCMLLSGFRFFELFPTASDHFSNFRSFFAHFCLLVNRISVVFLLWNLDNSLFFLAQLVQSVIFDAFSLLIGVFQIRLLISTR